MRFLFVKPNLAWPRSSGHDVHTFEMMRALAARGSEVALLTRQPTCPEATDGLDLVWQGTLDTGFEGELTPAKRGWMLRKFASYWGVPDGHSAHVAEVARRLAADVVVVVGLGVLPYLRGVRHAQRVWYAADEWVLHHATMFRPTQPSTYTHLKAGLIKGVYERAYAPLVDRVWVVSQADRRAASLFMGARAVDVIPNGVDADYYAPRAREERPDSLVFWGRLDFEPNIDALEWFVTRVWTELRRRRPGAVFSVFGFNPSPAVQRLAQAPGVELTVGLPDLREEIARRQVVVLPFVSGAGIKNKLLEAAAMGRPIIASPKALNGLRLADADAVASASTVSDWVREIEALWDDAARRERLGAAARRWVVKSHSWDQCAETALSGLPTPAAAAPEHEYVN